MAVSKQKRVQVKEKSGGVCWYCGEPLGEKGWHVDHVIPQHRYSEEHGCLIVGCRKFTEYGVDDLQNLVPACGPCNRWKSTHDLEYFRESIAKQPEARKVNTAGFRMGQRFGLIEIIEKQVVFWFETQPRFTPKTM